MARSIALALLHQGLVRKKNEDNLYVLDTWVPIGQNREFERAVANEDALQFFAVADGMGGSGIGDVAAQTVLQVLDQHRRWQQAGGRFDFVSFARDYIEHANQAVCQLLASYQGLPVGTTLSLLVIDRDTAYTVSLGNSRVYLYRDGQLYRLTEDHINRLPDRRQLTRYIGVFQEDAASEAENLTRTVLNKGDIFLLASDGITDYLTDEAIAGRLATPLAFVQQIRLLRNLALQAGGGDNLALIGVKIQDPSGSRSAQNQRHPAKASARAGQGRGPGQRQTPVRGDSAGLQNSRQYRWFKPLLFFLFFILLGILLGKLIFSMPAWLSGLFGRP